jgi:heme exporter protein B
MEGVLPLEAAPQEKGLSRRPSMHTGGGLTSFGRKVWAVLSKEIRTEIRAKEVFTTMILFGILAAIIFGMSFDLRVPRPEMVVPGILWVIVLFAGVVGLNRSFGAEVDRGTLAGLLLTPVDRSAIFFGKFLANLIFMLLMEILLLPVLLIMFDVNLFQFWILVGLLLGTVGYAIVGTFFAALTASVRARETMLPILLLPVIVPVFMAGISLTAGVIDERSMSGLWRWLIMLVVYDLIFLVVSYLVFDVIWEN